MFEHPPWFHQLIDADRASSDPMGLIASLHALVGEAKNSVQLHFEMQQLRSVEGRFSRKDRLFTSSRRLLKEGVLTKKCRRRPGGLKRYSFFLFNDVLVYAGATVFSKKLKTHQRMALSTVALSDLPDLAFEVRSSAKCIVVMASSHAEKASWMASIAAAIEALGTDDEATRSRSAFLSLLQVRKQQQQQLPRMSGAQDAAAAVGAAAAAASSASRAQSVGVVGGTEACIEGLVRRACSWLGFGRRRSPLSGADSLGAAGALNPDELDPTMLPCEGDVVRIPSLRGMPPRLDSDDEEDESSSGRRSGGGRSVGSTGAETAAVASAAVAAAKRRSVGGLSEEEPVGLSRGGGSSGGGDALVSDVMRAHAVVRVLLEGREPTLPRLSESHTMELFGLYKHIVAGECSVAQPQDPTACAKWTAWSKHRGKSLHVAMEEYVGALGRAVPDWRTRADGR